MIALLNPHSPRPTPPRFHIRTSYNPTPSPRPRSPRSRTHTIGRLTKYLTYFAPRISRNRGQKCGDMEFPGYLTNATGPVSLVLDLPIVHDRWGSSSDPTLNGNLYYPNDIDRSLNELLMIYNDKLL